MARKNKATPTRRALSRRGNKDETTFSKDEIVAVKSSGKLYKAKITRVREKNHYDIEYLDFEDQYSDNISSKKLSKYLPQYDNITTLPNKAKKSLESSNITSTVVDYQEKLTFITVFSNSKPGNTCGGLSNCSNSSLPSSAASDAASTPLSATEPQ